MKKAHFLALALLAEFFFSVSYAQVGWQWLKTPYNPAMEAYLCATDKWGNVYAGGGSLITSLDTSGNHKWTRSVFNAWPFSITADDFGNVYSLWAYTSATVTIRGHTLTNAHAPFYQFCIVKYDTSGSIAWAKNIGTAAARSGITYYQGIVCDNTGNFDVGCSFSNDPTIGTFSFTNHDVTDSTNDFLVAKMDSSGNTVWAKSFGGKKNDVITGIDRDASGNLFVAGFFSSDTLIFGSTMLNDTGTRFVHSNIFIAKLDTAGNPLWAQKEGGNSENVYLWGLAVSNTGEPMIIGMFQSNSVVFGTDTFSNPCYCAHSFLVRYNSSGGVVWAKDIRGGKPWSISVDKCDNFWICGSTGVLDTVDGNVLSAPAVRSDVMFIFRRQVQYRA